VTGFDRTRRRVVLLTIAVTGLYHVRTEGQSPETAIIQRLTAETHEEAVACGRRDPDCSVKPYQLCPSDGRYAARLATPFSRVASAVTETKSGRRPMTPGDATRWGVGIYVYPAENSAKPEAIQRVEIRRDGQAIPPTTSTVGPLTVKKSDGSTTQSTRGFFAFPADVFAPTTDVTIVFVGSGSETRCLLETARLRLLR